MAYKGKIDFITISLDDVTDIKTSVPRFLRSMKATMPAYLLSTSDESEAIALVSKDWAGNLPFTILFDDKGRISHQWNGRFRMPILQAEVERAVLLASEPIYVILDFVKIKDSYVEEAVYYYENNWKVYRAAALKRGVIDSYEIIKSDKPNESYDLILITRYRGKEQFDASEKNFEPILKELRPDGPKLLNSRKPNDFRQNVFAYQGPQIPAVK
jgi:hypothetical protein